MKLKRCPITGDFNNEVYPTKGNKPERSNKPQVEQTPIKFNPSKLIKK